MHGTGPERGPVDSDAVLLAAGAADWALGRLTTVVEGVRGLLGRSDIGELAQSGQQDLKARGRLFLDRLAPSSPAYLEVLARHVAERHADGGGRDGG